MQYDDHKFIFVGVQENKPVALVGDVGDKDITDLARKNKGHFLIINPNTRRYLDERGVWHPIDVAVKLDNKGPIG